jgi:hypothetical protein
MGPNSFGRFALLESTDDEKRKAMASMIPAEVALIDLDKAGGWSIFEAAAKQHLHMSGDEFLKAWNAGGFGPDPDSQRGVMDVAILLPFVR